MLPAAYLYLESRSNGNAVAQAFLSLSQLRQKILSIVREVGVQSAAFQNNSRFPSALV